MKKKSAWTGLAIILAFYLLSYAALSAGGRYHQYKFWLGGHITSRWIPAGMLQRGWRGDGARIIYYPLWLLDCRFIHRDRESPDKLPYSK